MGQSHRPRQDRQADSESESRIATLIREWPDVRQAGCKDRPAKPTAAARAGRLVTNHVVTRTVTHGPVSATRRHS